MTPAESDLPEAKPQETTVSEEEILEQEERAEMVRELRNRLLLRALLIGVVSGLLAVAFRYLLCTIEEWRTHWYTSSGMPAWKVFLYATGLATFGTTLSVWMVRKLSPEAAGSGIPHVKSVLLYGRVMRWKRVIFVKFFGGLLALGSGLSLGREGPTVQMGAATGKMVGLFAGMRDSERFVLIAAGAGAGLSASFNAPLAGLVFVLEELQRNFRARTFFVALLASASADVVSRFCMGQGPIFHMPIVPTPPLEYLPLFAVLGALAGVGGVAFNRSLMGSLKLYDRVSSRPCLLVGLFVGVSIGLAAVVDPRLIGSGHDLTESALAMQIPLASVLVFLVIRFGLTLISYGSGAPGGIFAPLLVLGALLGLGFALSAKEIFPIAPNQMETFAVVGMAALFSSIVRAPLTGIVLIVEMTGEHALMLPLLVACLIAYFVAEMMGNAPIYQSLLSRNMRKV